MIEEDGKRYFRIPCAQSPTGFRRGPEVLSDFAFRGKTGETPRSPYGEQAKKPRPRPWTGGARRRVTD